MFAPHIVPLMAIPSALSEAMATAVLYRAAADTLLENTCVLDAVISDAIAVEPGDQAATYSFDRSLFDSARARDVFLKIREQRKALQAQRPLLSAVENLVDYIAHMTTNVIAKSAQSPRRIAEVSNDGLQITYHEIDTPSYEWSLALYMGISPLPIFGTNIPVEEAAVATQLASFGFGAFTYLYLLCHPDTLQEDRLPADLPYYDFPRPIAAAPIYRNEDKSLTLSNT